MVIDMIYLASPFTHSDKQVEFIRYKQTCQYLADMFRKGLFAFSPIAHCYYMAREFELPSDYEYWKSFNMAMLARCDKLYVLMLDGWRESRGVRDEMDNAYEMDFDVVFVEPNFSTNPYPDDPDHNLPITSTVDGDVSHG